MTRGGAAIRTVAQARERVRRFDARVGAPLSVLAYHRVATPRCDPWHLAVSAINFSAHVEVMRELGQLAPLEVALGRRRRRAGCRPCFAITFDDAYIDNLDNAVTVLERHDAPATLFVPTHFIGGKRFWWDRLDAIVLDADTALEDVAEAFAGAGVEISAGADRAAYHADLHERIVDSVRTRSKPSSTT